MNVLIGIFAAWAAAWAVVVTAAPSLWVVALLGFLQNLAFTFVSRGRNSGSLAYHMVASVFSNGIWLGMFVVGVKIAAKAPTFPTEFAIVYTLSTMAGSVFAHWLARKVEKGAARNVQEDRVAKIEDRLRGLEKAAGVAELSREEIADNVELHRKRLLRLDALEEQVEKCKDIVGLEAPPATEALFNNFKEEVVSRIEKLEKAIENKTTFESRLDSYTKRLETHIMQTPIDAKARQELTKLAERLDALRADVRGEALVEVKKRLATLEAAAGQPSSTIKGLQAEVKTLRECLTDNSRYDGATERRLEKLEAASGVVYDPEKGEYDYSGVQPAEEGDVIDTSDSMYRTELDKRVRALETTTVALNAGTVAHVQDLHGGLENHVKTHEELEERLRALESGDNLIRPRKGELEQRVEKLEIAVRDKLENLWQAAAFRAANPDIEVGVIKAKVTELRNLVQAQADIIKGEYADENGEIWAVGEGRLEALSAKVENDWDDVIAITDKLGTRLEKLETDAQNHAAATMDVASTVARHGNKMEDVTTAHEKQLQKLSAEVARIAGKLISLPMARLQTAENHISSLSHRIEHLEETRSALSQEGSYVERLNDLETQVERLGKILQNMSQGGIVELDSGAHMKVRDIVRAEIAALKSMVKGLCGRVAALEALI
jgi:chromosome segregation ATPase